jgi:methyl-accepting chemotaxis protein
VDQVNTAVSQMDKVTQQNASTAEESASASEELSAQAQTVKGIVSDLATLITGRQTGGDDSPALSARQVAAKTKPRAQKPSMVTSHASSGRAATTALSGPDSDLEVGDLKEF